MAERHAQPPDPPAPHLAGHAGDLTQVAGALLFGILAGAAIAQLLRARRLAWTWPLLSLSIPLALGVGVVTGPLGPGAIAGPGAFMVGLLVGSLTLGISRRVEDHRVGGDREAAARRRRAPSDPIRRGLAEHHPLRERNLAEGIPIGRTERGQLAFVRRGTKESGSHVLVPGATGAGKTTSLAALLTDYVVRSGFGAIVLEAKPDRTLLRSARAAAESRGVRLRLVSPEGASSYDPLAGGSVDERSERLIAVEAWGSADADFYRQAASPFLRLVIRVLDAVAIPTSLCEVARACDPDRIRTVAKAADPALTAEISATTKALGADERRAVAGLRARLANLADSGFARDWLDPATAPEAPVDIAASIRRRDVLYFRFDTDRTGNVGRAIAQMVLLDLGATASSIMGKGVGTFVAVDEFGALEAPALDRLFARGRAAGLSVAVGTQTIADLREAGPAVRERVGATVESILCHRIGNQDDAEWIAQLIGTVPDWQSTIRTDGFGMATAEGTRTRGHRFEVNPSQLQRLAIGQAYVARLDLPDETRAKRVGVVPPWERLTG
jgi:hypothetical protein